MPTGICARFGGTDADWDAAVSFAHERADDEDRGALHLLFVDAGIGWYAVVSTDQLPAFTAGLGAGAPVEELDVFRYDGDGAPR